MRKMKTIPKTVEFMGKTHKLHFRLPDHFWGCSGTYHFTYKGYRIEIEYYGDEDEFDTVTAELSHDPTEWVDSSLSRKARSLRMTLKMAETRIRKHMEKANG